MHVFSLSETLPFAERVSDALGQPLSAVKERHFEDGEHKSRSLVDVANHNVYVIQSLYSDGEMSVNDKLCRLLFFVGSLKDAGARSVTAVIPYLCYARKDRRTRSDDPVTTRYMASMIEAVGADCIVTMDVHNISAFENAFRLRSEHLQSRYLMADRFARLVGEGSVVVVSPDAGGIKRAEYFRMALAERLGRDVRGAFMEKYRSGGEVRGEAVVGDVEDGTVIVIDDLISTGGTLARAAGACARMGAGRIFAAATHGLFTGDAEATLRSAGLEKLMVANTVPPFRLSEDFRREKLDVIDVTGEFARAIRSIEEGSSPGRAFLS